MPNCICDIYTDYATFHTAVETVDDTKIIAVGFPIEAGRQKYVIVKME